MNLKKLGLILFVAAGIILFFLLWSDGSPISQEVPRRTWEPKLDEQGPVSVEVAPEDLSPDAAVWKFKVTLNTHSVELDEDMSASAILIDDAGRRLGALAWEGDPPGGHHREGRLVFKSLTPFPSRLEVRIQNVGSIPLRIFEWKGGEFK